MQAIITILLLALFSGIIFRTAWFRSIGMSTKALWVLFIMHALAAIAYGLLHDRLYNGGDTFNMYRTGVDMAMVFGDNPYAFGQALIGPIHGNIPTPLNQYPDALDYWEHYSSYSIVRLHAILHLATFGGGYYAHAVALSFALFWGYCVLLKSYLTNRQGNPWQIALFLLGAPTVFFFGNGLHKESIVILALSLLFARLLHHRLTVSWQTISGVMVPFVLILFVKEFYLAALVIPWLVYAASQHYPNWKPGWSALANALIWVIIGVISWYALDQLVFHHLQAKQALFLALDGNANVYQYPLQQLTDLPIVLLQGIKNTLLLPAPDMWNKLPLAIYGVENYVVIALFVGTLLFKKSSPADRHRLVLLCGFFCCSILIIGIVVPNMGAIARYKAPALFALLVAISLYWFPEKETRS